VLVVPSFYTQPERQALLDAAEIADMKVALPPSLSLLPFLPHLALLPPLLVQGGSLG
jgi:hypothetical protein